jgi:hypothetical protein
MHVHSNVEAIFAGARTTMMEFRKDRIAFGALAALCLLLCSGLALAELIPITLAGLLKEASVVAYGSSVRRSDTSASSSIVWFQPVSMLRGESLAKGEAIKICNDPTDSESYDLRQFDEPYIVFAKKGNDCYVPVHRMSSIVPVSNGTAATWRIQGEPEKQPLSAFLKKVTSLIGARPSRLQKP